MQIHCKACAAYIADWYDQELHGAFDTWTLPHLQKTYLPQATEEITRFLMKYIKEYDSYTKMRDVIQTHIRFSGVPHTLHIFSTSIPIVKQTVDMLDNIMAESSASNFIHKQGWIRHKLFELFLDLIDVHGVHLGKIEFADIWKKRYLAKTAATSNIP